MYADSIYTGHEGPHIIAPYTGINSPACMKHMNKVMSGLRISVEWSIGKAYAICGFLRRQEVSYYYNYYWHEMSANGFMLSYPYCLT